MAIVNEIKCARCDRKYSGVRSRCPYCGARRIGRGKYSEDSDNAKGKMLISVLILAVFTVAAGILLFTTPVEVEDQDPEDDPSITSPEDDIESMLGIHPEPTMEPPPEEPEEPEIVLEVTSLRIMYDGRVITDFTQGRGVPIELRASIEPPGIDVEIIWESSNPEVFEAVPVDVGGVGVKVTGIENGDAQLILRAGDQETTCWVRIRNP